MKKSLILLLSLLSVTSTFSQYQTKYNISYSQPYQVDSSEYFIIGPNINETNKTKFNVSRGRGYTWTNLIFYNSKTKESKLIFNSSPLLVSQVSSLYNRASSWSYSVQEKNSSFLTSHCVLLLVQEDENKNGIIDDDDITSLYIISKTGTNLTKISPAGAHVKAYTLSQDEKTLLMRIQKDMNKDNKYFDEDEIFYQINLDKDFSKISGFEIKLK